jgi:hypothetical protein
MSAQVLTTFVTLSGLGLALAALALSAARIGRLRAAREATDRRLDALAGRVAALEARATAVRTASPAPPTVRAPVTARRADGPEHHTPAAPTLIAVPNLAPTAPGPTLDPASSGLGRRFAAVWDLADAGATAEAIARATGQPVGQVELILGLKRQLAAASAGTAGTRLP